MSRQEPMLMESPLTKRVFIVTSYVDEGDGIFTARQKFDVTEQFDVLAAIRRGECELSEIDTDDTASEWMSNRWWVFDSVYRCSCGATFGHVAEERPNFCPACGDLIRKAVKR